MRCPLRTVFGHVCVQTKNALCRFLAKTTERGCAARLGLPQARCSTTNQRCRPLDVILAPTVDVWKPACTREAHQTLNAFSIKCTHVVFLCVLRSMEPVARGAPRRVTTAIASWYVAHKRSCLEYHVGNKSVHCSNRLACVASRRSHKTSSEFPTHAHALKAQCFRGSLTLVSSRKARSQDKSSDSGCTGTVGSSRRWSANCFKEHSNRHL